MISYGLLKMLTVPAAGRVSLVPLRDTPKVLMMYSMPWTIVC